ncbi:MAG: hypothetical protein AAFV96_03845 [Pseudomonadota bacterium]
MRQLHPAGQRLAPVLRDAAGDLGPEDLRAVLPILRKLRSGLVSR